MADLRVLLLVAEPWRGDDSGGNTMDNFFRGMKGVEFAQICCNDKLPSNDVCTKYLTTLSAHPSPAACWRGE